MIPFPFQTGQLGRGGSQGDLYYGNVSSLLHMNGADTSTTFTDEKGKTWTASAPAQIVTAQSKYGGASGVFSASTSRIYTTDHADFDFGSGDFTIEGYVRLNTVTGSSHILAKDLGAESGPFAIYRSASQIGFYASSNGSAWDLISNQTFGTGLTTGVWYYLAVTRSGTAWRTFRDGVLIATSGAVSGTLRVNTEAVALGNNNTATSFFNGWLDEWRITKGVARYTDTFTAPTSEFPGS